MNFFIALENVLMLFSLIMIGFLVGKKNIVKQTSQADLTNLVVYVAMPSTIIYSMIRQITINEILDLFSCIIAVFIAYLTLFLISSFITKFYNIDLMKKDVHLTSILLANVSLMGYPIIESLLGKNGLFYAVFTQGFTMEIISWTLGISILERNTSNKMKKNTTTIKQIILRPGIIAIIIGFFFLFTQVKPPTFIYNTLSMISKATPALAMISIGIVLSRTNITNSIKNKYFYITSFFKLIIAPLTMFIILKLFNIQNEILKAGVIEFAMPTAAYVNILSTNVKNDSITAAEQIFISTFLSIITIPIVVLLLIKFA